MRRTRPGFDLLLITDGRPELVERIARALQYAEPGRVAVALREPERKTAELVALGHALRAVTDARGALLLVNDRVDIALAVDADGVHLPEAGFAPRVARQLLGSHALIGVSRHDPAGLLEASAQGADYATLSPVHAVAGKATPLGIEGFASCAALSALPLYALGGVRIADVASLLAAGARGIAVIREVLAAGDPAGQVRRLLDAAARSSQSS